tara:strand:+ start:355 stop:522 length:168 start_codon:yes stop_codon:yes gene_type:complete
MNLRERGFRVGDLLILIIVFVLSTFLIKKVQDNKNQKQFSNLYVFEIPRIINSNY